MNVGINGIVPVHLKNSNGSTDSGRVDANQLVHALAYSALVEEQMKVRVEYALVIYAGQQVRKVEFTDARRQWLLQTIHEVEAVRARLTANRNHDHRGRCAGCGVRSRRAPPAKQLDQPRGGAWVPASHKSFAEHPDRVCSQIERN